MEIGLSYNDTVSTTKFETNESSSSEEEIEEPYVVPKNLRLPVGMNLVIFCFFLIQIFIFLA